VSAPGMGAGCRGAGCWGARCWGARCWGAGGWSRSCGARVRRARRHGDECRRQRGCGGDREGCRAAAQACAHRDAFPRWKSAPHSTRVAPGGTSAARLVPQEFHLPWCASAGAWCVRPRERGTGRGRV